MMPVDEPRDVLEELHELASGYVGQGRPWVANAISNPIKLRARYEPSEVFAHSSPRNSLSAREGAALIYALRSQGPVSPGLIFSRVFLHADGRRDLVIEDGVIRDLLAVGMISHSEHADRFYLTGLGSAEITRCFRGN
ncbi:MAG: hypothetical protein IT538_04380 [Variibacter sp.]|nr:hypothetical protein [Variibacter sp.]